MLTNKDTQKCNYSNSWKREYLDIDSASQKIQILQNEGFVVKGYFVLSNSSWLDNYYTPLETSVDAFLTKHKECSHDAKALVDADSYKTYADYYSYVFYIAQKQSMNLKRGGSSYK